MKTKKWKHYRAKLQWEILVVLDTWEKYEVCWGWECWVSYDEVEIISLIRIPKKIQWLKLYYHNETNETPTVSE